MNSKLSGEPGHGLLVFQGVVQGVVHEVAHEVAHEVDKNDGE